MTQEHFRVQREMTSGKSKFRRYGELIVGKTSLGSIIKYELVTMFIATPGAFGLWIRSKLYPTLLKSCGGNVHFGRNVVLRHPHKIEIGDDVVIDDNCLLDAKGEDNKGISIGSGSYIGRNSILSSKNGDIQLEANVNMGFNSEIFSGSSVKVGQDTHIAAYCYIIGGGHDIDDECAESIREQKCTSHGIEVGRNCWLGAGVKVLDGIKIGDQALLGAGAVITKDVPEYAVAVGIPAQQVGSRKKK